MDRQRAIDGPDQYWSDSLPASRGQLASIAELSCELLGLKQPESRLDATVTIVRLKAAIAENMDVPKVARAW
jgi:hypothetical protein